MANYTKRELPDMKGTGAGKAYYQMEITRRVDFHEFIERCAHHGGFQASVLTGAVAHVAHELALTLAQGYSVTIDGLGTFTSKLGVRPDMEQDCFSEDEQHRNALTLRVSGVNYRADKEFVADVDDHCRLERGANRRLHRSPYNEQERIARARHYLSERPYMRVADYACMTGLSYTTASRELVRLSRDPASGIVSEGRKSAKVYLLRRAES